ncbi:outer membrane receptor protein involved in Fe transport [Christiangramia gaetbulicola]|uniref:Outer membrane receptor protein involved in Fe transport n=1 Tax=Christiangramia gaetbulicola TaxID=703340 RepID=A0A2T6AJ44_9FLAO|nr:TonB-dependent receptor [Christiangramia gaetbulicola]PTX43786.1 outer membrane receptor protein involved in Fe transport [Christiangramia gaetbulicola]
MKFRYLALLLLFLFFNSTVNAQQLYTLNGVITDASSNETLIGVNLLVPEASTGVVTNDYGYYSIKLPQGEYEIEISYIGYQSIQKTINLDSNQKLDFQLTEASESLDEVVITSDIEGLNIRKPEMSVNKLSISTIQKLPVVFGEVDVVRSLLLLPGVSNAGEGSSGFNVRGGAVDQNLILLDEATIYNSSHLFGLFSVFNPDAIKDLKLYKGGIPAKYGGRVSSVLDIYQRDGNSKEFKMQGGIGAISSRLLAEGPIVKDKGSFLIGGRSSYAHLFLKLTDNENSAYFYDLNTKLSYNLDDRNKLLLSGYFGRDVFNISQNFENTYGNAVLNLRWNHIFSDNIFTNLSVIYSDYYYGLNLNFVGFNWDSGIKNLNIKYDFNHYINDNLQLKYGMQNTYYEFNPGEIKPIDEDSGINYFKLTNKYAFENAVYLSAEHRLSDKFSAEYGLRLSTFLRLGQDEINVYEDNHPVEYDAERDIYREADILETVESSRSEVLKAYNNFEPRIALAYTLDENQSIKASYNRMAQYLHLISNTSSPTPLDVWAPSGSFIKPQVLDQYAVGYFRNFKENEFSLEVEGFYKDIDNRIDYIDGANLIANNAIERVVLNGESRAYGMELLLRKNTGRLTGWLAYTLSKSEQRTPGRTAIEPGINNGNWYNTNYDKTHDLSMTGSYELNRKWQLNANFIFQTGLATTYPNAQYEYEGINIPVYGERNGDRLPSYHRLDLSATYEPGVKEGKKVESFWTFGLYNVYNRQNAYSISFRENSDTGENEAVRLSLFGIIPSVTYNFKF